MVGWRSLFEGEAGEGKLPECSVSFSSIWVFFFPAHWHLLLLHFLWFLKRSLIGSLGKTLLCYILWWMFSVRPRGVCGGWRGAKTRQLGYFTCLRSCWFPDWASVGLMPRNSHSLFSDAKDNAARVSTLLQRSQCKDSNKWKTAWIVPLLWKPSVSFPAV